MLASNVRSSTSAAALQDQIATMDFAVWASSVATALIVTFANQFSAVGVLSKIRNFLTLAAAFLRLTFSLSATKPLDLRLCFGSRKEIGRRRL